jgi:methionyl-tRNA formyltransferase
MGLTGFILLFFMRIALLTNSKLSVPAIGMLGSKNMLVSVGLPEANVTEDADHVRYTAASGQVPVTTFSRTGLRASLEQWLDDCRPDLVLVFTFPFKIPANLLDIPSKGFINFHFGVLPQYRGADAIFWQIANREKEGGVSVHQMNDRFDQGPLYLVHKVPLSMSDTYGSHLLNLSMAAIPAVEKLLAQLQLGQQPVEQDHVKAAYYKRPSLPDVTIDWQRPAAEIIALVNACNPWNKGAVAYLDRHPVKIISAAAVQPPANLAQGRPGQIALANEASGCFVWCGSQELIKLEIIFCNDSFITGNQFARLGIFAGMRFDNVHQSKVA